MRARTDPEPVAGEGPVRTCVGCRRRAGVAELSRVVAETPTGSDPVVRLVVDLRHRLPGRGAWVHRREQCVEQAIRRRAFARALRITAGVDTEAVVRHVSPPSESRSTSDEPAMKLP
ncbi:YlxR family protein [Jatrophihabitans sp. YIM 134969]